MSAHHLDQWQRQREAQDLRPTEPPIAMTYRKVFGPPGAWQRCSKKAGCTCRLCQLDEQVARCHQGG